MDEELEQQILHEYSSSRCWNQSFIFRIKGIPIDLSSSCGANPTTPLLVSQDPKLFQQPKEYPQNTCFRFPKSFKGIESESALVSAIKDALPGVDYVKHTGKKGTVVTRINLFCGHKVRIRPDISVFKEGAYRQSGLKTETVKNTKSAGSLSSLQMMGGKKERNSTATASKCTKYSSNQPLKRQSYSFKECQCPSKISIFMWPNDKCYYLDSKQTCLNHAGHSYIDQSNAMKQTSELSDDSIELIQKLSTIGIKPSKISQILQIMDKSDSSFKSKAISNLVKRCEVLQNQAIGIDHKMSTAEKAVLYLSKNNITHRVIYDDPNLGLVAHSRPRGRPPVTTQLTIDDTVKKEIRKLRKELSFDSKTKLVLMISYATAEMVKMTMMYPEVFFVDCTGRANRQKRDVFVLVVRTPQGKCHIGNITIMPSGKAWVFRYIFKYIFPSFYGQTTVQRNRLVLTDEDEAEFRTMRSLILVDPNYSNSTSMLCTFHAIWQPFKDNIRNKLPRKNQQLTKLGHAYGGVLLNWFMRLCNENETKEEYNRSFQLLYEFLDDRRTKKHLSSDCINATKIFASTLQTKESQLANYVRRYVTNCMDSLTTSPVESQNSIIHKHLGISSNMDIHTGIERLSQHTDQSIKEYHKESLHSLNQSNKSSCAPTKDKIVTRSQSLADQNFDKRGSYKGVQHKAAKGNTDPYWWVWHFRENEEEVLRQWPWSALPRYHRVRLVKIKRKDGLVFLWCDCGFYDRIGIPCAHIFFVVKEMSLRMFHVRHMKIFTAHYGDGSRLSDLMMKAQDAHFLAEGMGVMVTQDQLDKCYDSFQERDNPNVSDVKFHFNTSENDYKKAAYVLNRSTHVGCTCKDLEKFVQDGLIDPYHHDEEQHDTFDGPFRSVGMLSPGVKQLQDRIHSNSHKQKSPNKQSQHDKDLDIHLLSRSTPTTGRKTRDECRKNVITNLDQLINSDRISDDKIRKFDAAVENLKHEIFMSLDKDESSREHSLDKAESSAEHSSTSDCDSTTDPIKSTILDGHFEMACDESLFKKREERRKNGLG